LAEGLDYLHEAGDGERLPPVFFSGEVADTVREIAIIESTDVQTLIARALSRYSIHLRMSREGYEGPVYVKDKENPNLLERLGIFDSKEKVIVQLPSENL